MKNNVRLSHFLDWGSLKSDEAIRFAMREFADNGIQDLVLTSYFCDRLIKERGFGTFLYKWLKDSGTRIFECHAPDWIAYDLGISDMPRRPGMVEDQKLCMEYAAGFGCRTYVVHMGSWDSYYKPEIPAQRSRDLTIETLEKLIPHAEKLGLVIALENSFERPNTPDEVLYYLDHFKTPVLGACYDSGHANMMADIPGGKNPEKYPWYTPIGWPDGVVRENQAVEKMAPHIVTCHLHDNDGYDDQHTLPGLGTIDWKTLIPKFLACPRLLSLQSEVCIVNHGISIRKLVTTFEKILN